MTSAVLLFSGGLDSFILWRLLGMPRCVYVCLGHRYQSAELNAIRLLHEHLNAHGSALEVWLIGGLHLGNLERPDGHIPNRNLLLTSFAFANLDADIIYLGALRGEASRDKDARFLRLASKTLTHVRGKKVRVVAPAQRYTKTELVGLFLRLYPEDAHLLRFTTSCYEPHDPLSTGCGRCMACFRRWVAMTNNGFLETYDRNPATWEQVQQRAWRDWMRALGAAHWQHWPHIIRSNLDAYHALKRARAWRFKDVAR
jgi:7-cyano-7-deazaguanine synthase in queuosine biosynthesis